MTIINSIFKIKCQVSAFKRDHTCAFSAKGSWTVSVSVWVCNFWRFFKSGVAALTGYMNQAFSLAGFERW